MSDPRLAPTPTLPQGGRESSTEWQPVMRSPMNEIHRGLGAALAVIDGWEIPRHYGDFEKEKQSITAGLGIADITARGKIDIHGALDGALASLPAVHDAALARISREWALVLTPAATLPRALELIAGAAGPNAMVTDATSIYSGIALLGPRVDDLLQRLITVDPASLTQGDCVATQMLRLPAILIRRALPPNAVDVYVPSEFGRYAWEAVFEVAHPLDPQATGWDALTGAGWH